MQKLFILPCLLFCNLVYSQPGDTTGQAAKWQHREDSVKSALAHRRDSQLQVLKLSDTALVRQSLRNSTNYFVQLQKENRARQKKAAVQKIIFGVALLVVLIIGLRRKRRNK